MDRSGRTQFGGAGDRYVMPRYEDGSTYGPGDEFYDWVASTFSPQQWNNMPDDRRADILDGWSNQQLSKREMSGAPMRPERPQIDNPRIRDVHINDFLSAMDKGRTKSKLPLKGLFGGR